MNNSITTIEIKRLLLSHNIFTAGRTFFEIFLNVFIWKLTGDLILVAWFNIIYLLMHTLTFHGFADLVKSGKVHLPRQIALIGFTLTYLVIYFLKEGAINHVLLIAAVIGFFNGMYWISYQILRFDLTNTYNRGNYAGLEKGFKQFIDITMPILGGAIIVANFYGSGYSNLFLVGTIMFAASLVIGNIKFPLHKTLEFDIRKTFSIIWKNKDIMKSMFSFLLSSFSRGGTIARLVLPLLIFNVMKDEFQLGGLLSFFAVVAIFGSVAFGRFVNYKHYKNLLFIGGIVYSLLLLLILVYPSLWIYVIFGALVKVVDILIAIPKRVISENLINSLDDEKNHRVEYIVIREWFSIGFGRVMSFVMLLMIGELEMSEMKLLLGFMAIAVFVEVWLLRSIKIKI